MRYSTINTTQENCLTLKTTKQLKGLYMKLTYIVLTALIAVSTTTACATVTSSSPQPQHLPRQHNESLPRMAYIDTCFTPGDDCEQRIIDEIKTAKKFVLIQAYSFTSAPIAKAIINASKRKKMIVEVILDKSQISEKYTAATFFKNQKMITYIDDKHKIAHNKIIIIDGTTLITGSYNFTKSAQKNNAENIIIIKNNPTIINKYISNALKHRQHSTELN